MSQETAATMMERYLRGAQQMPSAERPRSASVSSASSEEKENQAPKRNFLTPTKKRAVDVKINPQDTKIMTSLASPNVDSLKKKSKKDLRKEMALLIERLNAMEENQVEYIKTVTSMKDEIDSLESKLEEVTKERDTLANQNAELTAREQNRSDTMWKSFIGGQSYVPQKPSFGL
jgi:hypothetical protein